MNFFWSFQTSFRLQTQVIQRVQRTIATKYITFDLFRTIILILPLDQSMNILQKISLIIVLSWFIDKVADIVPFNIGIEIIYFLVVRGYFYPKNKDSLLNLFLVIKLMWFHQVFITWVLHQLSFFVLSHGSFVEIYRHKG